MVFYFLSYFLFFILSITNLNSNKRLRYFLYTILGLFLCFGFFCGSDWRSYENFYNDVKYKDFSNLKYYEEFGFTLYMKLFSSLNIDFWDFTVITKSLCYIVFIATIEKYLNKFSSIAIMYFVPCFGFYLFIDCPFRNLIAITIFLLSIKYLIQKKKLIYISFICLAATFHFSAFIFFLLPFLFEKKISSKIWIILFITIYILFTPEFIKPIIGLIGNIVPYVELKFNGYIVNDSEFARGRIFSIGMLIPIVFFILFLKYRKSIENNKLGIPIFNMTMLYLLFYRLAVSIEIFYRFQLYVSLFFCIAMVLLLLAIKKSMRTFCILAYFLIASIGMSKLTSDYRYIPYTSYIPYIFTDYPTYEYRSSYNFINSPYATRH